MIFAVRATHRDVGEQAGDEPGADRRAVHRRHDRLRAVDDVEHEVARLADHPQAPGVVVDDAVDELEAAAGRERLAGALQHDDARLGVAVDGEPHVGELAVHLGADGVEPGTVERDPQHLVGGTVEREVGEVGVAIGRQASPAILVARPRRPLGGRLPCSLAHGPAPNILILCTGNATRSVIAGAVLKAHLPHVEIATGGTMSIDGLPMSWRTKAGFEAVGVTPPSHRSRQVLADDLDRATLSSASHRSTSAGSAARTPPPAAHGDAEAVRRRARRRRPPTRRARRRARPRGRRAGAVGGGRRPGGGEVEG